MKYTVEIAGRTIQVEVDGGNILLEGRPVQARLAGAKGSALRRLVRGRSHQGLHVSPGEGRGAWQLVIGGFRLEAQVLAPRDIAARSAGKRKGGAASGAIKAPMPGLVVRVLVAEGDTVEAGQGVVVVEAMKMENVLKAPASGTVQKVHVAAGARVEKGAPLLLIS